MRKILMILLTLIMIFALTACGSDTSSTAGTTDPSQQSDAADPKTDGTATDKSFAFPAASFVPEWAVYKGSGEYVFTDTENTNLEDRSMNTYLDGATLEDVQAYIVMLKEKGLTYAGFAEESLEIDSSGVMSWYGVNEDKSFTVWVNFFNDKQEITDNLFDTGTHNYNLQIQVANYDYYSN